MDCENQLKCVIYWSKVLSLPHRIGQFCYESTYENYF